jgi:hypothetical protein
LSLEEVGPVETGRRDVEHDLAWSGLGVRPLLHGEDLGSAGSVSHHSAHGGEPRRLVEPQTS